MDERHAESKSYYSHALLLIVFLENEIPKVFVSKFGVLNGDDEVIIFCNVTQTNDGKGPLAALERISWFKDNFRVQSVRCPVPNVPEDTLSPLLVKNGGNYTCVLELLLRGATAYKVSDYTVIKCEFDIGNGTQ